MFEAELAQKVYAGILFQNLQILMDPGFYRLSYNEVNFLHQFVSSNCNIKLSKLSEGGTL